MLEAKRGQIRRQMRGEELGRLFSLRRKSLLEGRLQVSRELFAEVEAAKDNGGQYELAGRLLACHRLYPEDENTYILIINYLIDHSDSHPLFIQSLLSFPPALENHAYALYLIATFLA